MKYNYDIIIAHYGVGHLTDLCVACLKSIRANSENYRIIFIDNNSDLDHFGVIQEELNKNIYVLIRNTTNLGFIKAANQGLALATAPFIVLLNNDTEVVPGWLNKLNIPLTLGAHISGPLTTTKDSWQGKVSYAPYWEFLTKKHMLAFFCTMFRKEVFDTCGFLDEDFGVGFGDDDWYCWKAQKAGFKLALVRDLLIKHYHRSTFNHLYGKDKVLEMQTKALNLYHIKQKIALGLVK